MTNPEIGPFPEKLLEDIEKASQPPGVYGAFNMDYLDWDFFILELAGNKSYVPRSLKEEFIGLSDARGTLFGTTMRRFRLARILGHIA